MEKIRNTLAHIEQRQETLEVYRENTRREARELYDREKELRAQLARIRQEKEAYRLAEIENGKEMMFLRALYNKTAEIGLPLDEKGFREMWEAEYERQMEEQEQAFLELMHKHHLQSDTQ